VSDRGASFEHTIESACAALLATVGAETDGELEKWRRGFNRAYKVAWAAAWANKRRDPFDEGQGLAGFHGWKDRDLGHALLAIGDAMQDNPLFSREDAGAAAVAIRAKVEKLMRLVSRYSGPYESESDGPSSP
jgi:hypothetical protein